FQATFRVNMVANPKRHCWECLRRCLVCDSTKPACNRCTAAGTPCPGYGDVKPTRLRWLTPGTVRSRVPRRLLLSGPGASGRDDQGTEPANPATPQRATLPNVISIPRCDISRHADVLTHCAEYCKSNPLSLAIGHVFLTSVP